MRRQGLQPDPHHARHHERGAPFVARRLRRQTGAHAGYARDAWRDRQGRGAGQQQPRLLHAAQFSNPANPDVHYNTTGPELVEQLERIDAFISGVGTGGTISGTGRYLREHLQNKPLIVAVEPKNSPVLSGGEPGFHKIQGIGAGFVPQNLDTHVYQESSP